MELLTAQIPAHLHLAQAQQVPVSAPAAAYDACPCVKYPVPCHMDEPYCSAVPYDQQLQIQTDIEYEMDMSLFEGLGNCSGERALMVALQDASEPAVYQGSQVEETGMGMQWHRPQHLHQNTQHFNQQEMTQQTGFIHQNYHQQSAAAAYQHPVYQGDQIDQGNYADSHHMSYTGCHGYQRTVSQHPLLQNYNNQVNNMVSSQPTMRVGDALQLAQDNSVHCGATKTAGYRSVRRETGDLHHNTSDLHHNTSYAAHAQSNQHWYEHSAVVTPQEAAQPLVESSSEEEDKPATQCDILEVATRCIIEDISDSGDSRPPSVSSCFAFDAEVHIEENSTSTADRGFPKSANRFLDFGQGLQETDICSIVEPVEGQENFTVTAYQFLPYELADVTDIPSNDASCTSDDVPGIQEHDTKVPFLVEDEDMLYLCPEDFDDIQFSQTVSRKDISLDRSWQLFDVSHSTSVRFSPEQRAF